MPTPPSIAFAHSWAAAWNSHDVDAILDHFHDDVVFSSPIALQLVPQSGGVIRGKQALGAYWTRGLQLIPDLHFDVEAVFAGLNTIVIAYLNQRGNQVAEVFEFDGDLVRRGHGTYLGADANPVGLTGR